MKKNNPIQQGYAIPRQVNASLSAEKRSSSRLTIAPQSKPKSTTPNIPKLIRPSAGNGDEMFVFGSAYRSATTAPDPIGLPGQTDLGMKNAAVPKSCRPQVGPKSLT